MSELLNNVITLVKSHNINVCVVYTSIDKLKELFKEYSLITLDTLILNPLFIDTLKSTTSNKRLLLIGESFNEYIKQFSKEEQEQIISDILCSNGSDSSNILAVNENLAKQKMPVATINKNYSMIINLDNLWYEKTASVWIMAWMQLSM